jgi:predicted AAA+ superfamily ATPase
VKRYLTTSIRHDLSEKMLFLGGPRQVEKTTLALGLIRNAAVARITDLSTTPTTSQLPSSS